MSLATARVVAVSVDDIRSETSPLAGLTGILDVDWDVAPADIVALSSVADSDISLAISSSDISENTFKVFACICVLSHSK